MLATCCTESIDGPVRASTPGHFRLGGKDSCRDRRLRASCEGHTRGLHFLREPPMHGHLRSLTYYCSGQETPIKKENRERTRALCSTSFLRHVRLRFTFFFPSLVRYSAAGECVGTLVVASHAALPAAAKPPPARCCSVFALPAPHCPRRWGVAARRRRTERAAGRWPALREGLWAVTCSRAPLPRPALGPLLPPLAA